MRNATKEQIKEWNKKYYINNREKRKENYSRHKNKIVLWYKDLKRNLECERCGFSHPAALSFHHKEGEDKKMNICEMIRLLYSIENIKEEIKKCEVLCHNCHAIHHYGENF